MRSPAFAQAVRQVKETLRAAQSTSAVAQLTALQQHKLTPAQQAHVDGLLAQAYELTSQWAEVSRLLHPYEDRARTAALPSAVHQFLCLRLTLLHLEQGEPPMALHWARQALQLAELTDDARAQGEAHQALGKAYRLLGQPAFARQHYQAALNLHQALGARVLMAWSYFGLSAVATGSSAYALARQTLGRAFNLVREADDPLLYGLLCSLQASTLVLEETALLPEREEWFAQAQAVFTRIEHRRFLARTLGNWGDQLLQVGQWPEAQKLLQQALELGQELQDRRSLANALESLASLHTIQGHYETSRSYLVEALSWVEGHDHFVEAQVHLSLARLLWQQGDSAQACAALDRVVTLAVKSEAKQFEVAAQLTRAEIALAEGQSTMAEELLHHYKPDLENLQSVGLRGHLRFVEGSLARVNQQLTDAQETLEQARSMFEAGGRRWWLGRTCFALADVLAQQGRLPIAHQTMQRAAQEFQTLAAQPFLQQIKQWYRRHPLPPVKQAPTTEQPTAPLTLPMGETEGVTRLLRAAPFREVVIRELLYLLQRALPHSHVTLSEHSVTEEPRLLLSTQEQWRPGPQASNAQTLRLDVRNAPALYVAINPLPTLTPPVLNLLETARFSLELCAARERESLVAASEQQAEHLERLLPGMLYQSQAMRALAAQIHQIKGHEVRVLITGESGTGKELVARAIHALSDRRTQPFVPFNCASLSAELFPSHLFGHQRGAFTGASQRSEGVIRAAANGALFLDEIGELPLDVQPKLLRFLQEGEIHPLGESRPQKVNVRVIAATNRALPEMVKAGQFRADLYYRLNIIALSVPPLRDRREEIPLLARHFLAQHRATAKKPNLELAPETMDDLMVYDWPGNVRELENQIQRLVAFAPNDHWIPVTALSEELRPAGTNHAQRDGRKTNGQAAAPHSLKARLEDVERTAIVEALTRCHHQVSQAAAELGMSRGNLYAKLERYGITVPKP